MSRFNDLRLAPRLGIAFGALVLALVVVAVAGVTKMNALGTSVADLGDHDIVALETALTVEQRLTATAQNTVTHLYVYDGDLRAQDRIERQITSARDADVADLKKLEAALNDPSAAPLLARFTAARERFVKAYRTALARSRQETIQNVEERDGSRDYYLAKVVPALAAARKAGVALREELDSQVAGTQKDTEATVASGRMTIIVAGLVAVLLAAGLGLLVVRSIVRPLAVVIARIEMLRDVCITGLNRGMQAMAGGDLTHNVVPSTPEIEKPAKDEVGDVARALNSMRVQMGEAIGAYNQSRGQLGAARRSRLGARRSR